MEEDDFMSNEIRINTDDLLIMNLVHYFITVKNYNPVILHGVNDEIWLENLDNDYKLVRIVSHYIHNGEQFNYDRFKLGKILKSLKKKTFSINMPVVSIYTNIGDDVKIPSVDGNILSFLIKNDCDIKNEMLVKAFPDIVEKTSHEEKGVELFVKISEDINKNSFDKAKRVEKIFSNKIPYITYFIMFVCFFMFCLCYLLGNGANDVYTLSKLGANVEYLVRDGEFFRLFTCIFLHAGFIHLFCNMYSLYVIGPQAESFYGKLKYLFIFIFSGVCGSIFSLAFMPSHSLSVGCSGAIFGLLGAMLYFGYYYRVYLGNALKSQIVPIIFINLFIGMFISGVDSFAHIGGLVGGIFASMAVGVPDKNKVSDRANGSILLLIYLFFIIYLAFFMK